MWPTDSRSRFSDEQGLHAPVAGAGLTGEVEGAVKSVSIPESGCWRCGMQVRVPTSKRCGGPSSFGSGVGSPRSLNQWGLGRCHAVHSDIEWQTGRLA